MPCTGWGKPSSSPHPPQVPPPLHLPPLQFPGLLAGTTINWFLSWPDEALEAVSSRFLDAFAIECTPEVKQSLKRMMAAVHMHVTGACEVSSKAEGLGEGGILCRAGLRMCYF